jgi:hypothetical protein
MRIHDDGVQIVQHFENEDWIFVPLSQYNVYNIKSARTGLLMDIRSAEQRNGALLIVYKAMVPSVSLNQQFRLESVENGYCRIVAIHSGKVLSVEGRPTIDDGRIIHQRDKHQSNHLNYYTQQWRFEQSGNF